MCLKTDKDKHFLGSLDIGLNLKSKQYYPGKIRGGQIQNKTMSSIDDDDVFGEMVSDDDDEKAGNEKKSGTEKKEISASDSTFETIGDCQLTDGGTDEKPSKRFRSKSDTTGKRPAGGKGGGGVKRNERERKRVDKLNQGFDCLRQCFPDGRKNKRLSKVGTLKGAFEYIQTLRRMLDGSGFNAPASQLDMGNTFNGYDMINDVTGYTNGNDVIKYAMSNDVTGFYGTVSDVTGMRDATQFAANCDIQSIRSSFVNVIAPTDGTYAPAAHIRDVIGMETPKDALHVIPEIDDVHDARVVHSVNVTGIGNQMYPVNGMLQIDDVYALNVAHTSDSAGMGIPMNQINVISPPVVDDVYAPRDVNEMGNPIYANSLTDYLNHNAPFVDVFNSMPGGDPNCRQAISFESLEQMANITFDKNHNLDDVFSKHCSVVTQNNLNVPDSNLDTMSGKGSNQNAIESSNQNPLRHGSNLFAFDQSAFGPGSNPSAFGPGSNSSAFVPGSNPSAFGPGSNSSAFVPGSNPSTFGPGSNPPSAFGPGSNPSSAFGPGSSPFSFGPCSNPPSAFGPGSNPSAFVSGSNSSAFEPNSNSTMFGPGSMSTAFDLDEFQLMANVGADVTQLILGSQMCAEFPVQTSLDVTTEEMLSWFD